jgi:hypothetical protein
MSAWRFPKACAVVAAFGLCAYLAVVAYTKYAQSSRLKQEAAAVEKFHERESQYNKLLTSWEKLMPVKCGKSTGILGTVAFMSITRSNDGELSLETNDASYSRVSIDDLARLLGVESESVRSTLDALGLVESQEIIQSGPEAMIPFTGNDTHGYLHIDPSCSEAATISFWSKQQDNFTPNHPGPYVGLKGLGDGWYYYMEQR